MDFWDVDDVEGMYKLYVEYKNNNQWDMLAQLVPNLIKEYPQLIKYIINKIDSCYGEHRVYVLDTSKGIKIGYTKNSVEDRFAEKRYQQADSFEINEILREETFQAKGAVEFESKLKKLLKPYQIQTDMVMPGKGELYSKEHIVEILSTYDNWKSTYTTRIGIKPPN